MHVAPSPTAGSKLNWCRKSTTANTTQHMVGDQSVFRFEVGRQKRAFDELKLTAVMSPGAMLLLGSQPNRQGNLGNYFFLESDNRDDRPDRKMILMRLCQTQHDDLVSPGPLKLR